MIVTSVISRRYAKALVVLAAEKKILETVGLELGQLKRAFDAEKRLGLVLASLSLSMEKKKQILADLLEKMNVSQELKNFAGLLLAKGRMGYLKQIEKDFWRFADKRNGVVRVKVASAVELNELQRSGLRVAMEQQTGKKAVLEVQVDPGLLGGVQVQIEDRSLDGSLRTSLRRLGNLLKG